MSGSFRALLIGVPSYEDDNINDMAFIEDDLTELAEALRSTGYEVDVHDYARTDRESIDVAVERFFVQARADETLLLFVSGHGIHHSDTDYLVPRGATTWSYDFPGRCLPLDFGRYVERSQAGDVVVFVDACREGITLREKTVGNAYGWSEMEVRRTGARHLCYVYACSPGERASYTTSGSNSFSLFSRALSTVVVEESGPGTLREVRDRLQSAVDELCATHNCRQQNVRVRTETDLEDFVVFPRPERTAPAESAEHPWSVLAREHPVWKQVESGPGAPELKEAVCGMAGRLAARYERDGIVLAADPWRPAGFAERMTTRVGWLLSKVLNPEKMELSPAEGALLVAAPFLHAACWSDLAARASVVEPENLARVPNPSGPRSGYEQFFSSQSRLVRRASRATELGDGPGQAGIAWWMFHRWLARTPRAVFDGVLDELLAPALCTGAPSTDQSLVDEVFKPQPLSALLRALRTPLDPGLDRPVRQLAGSSPHEQRVREQLLTALLSVAHRLAIDPTMLPEVVVEHLGISYAVDLPELHATVHEAQWGPRGRTRVLHAACHHPAVGLALGQHAASLDTLLGAIDVQAGAGTQLTPLQDLPVHATADKVQAAENQSGKPAYESTDLRFRLADDRIQELLMGEQLYGDPALAVRELYQNALDACRYRDARTAHLRKHRAYPGRWSGRIDFVQGEENGRAYIECRDNGIGMGENELREVFSNAGMRFADLPEYLEEQAAWQADGISFQPNSRFGIGVLSYFMIADDITVTTCRLDREGHPGRLLQIDIAGPGALFYIQDLGRGHDAGTTVRLYLRSPDTAPSCTDLLRRLLWISDYAVTATEQGAPLRWAPGVLSEYAPLGTEHSLYSAEAVRSPDARVDATSNPDVWWCSTTGGILADGLWADLPLFGAVVNLTGAYVPELTVDRRKALRYDGTRAFELLERELPALMAPEAVVLSHSWLSQLAYEIPELADEALSCAIAAQQPWHVLGRAADIAVVGCFVQDDWIVEWVLDNTPPRGREIGYSDLPAGHHLLDWRLLAWAAAGRVPGLSVRHPEEVPVANPSDVLLLRPGSRPTPADRRSSRPDAREIRSAIDWPAPDAPVPVGHLAWLRELTGRSLEEITERLAELGFRLPEPAVLSASPGPDDLLTLSRDLDRRPSWLDREQAVPLIHVLMAAGQTSKTPTEVADRLAALGYRVPDPAVLPAALRPGDLAILDNQLDPDEPVPFGQVLLASSASARPPREVADRLVELGFRVPERTAWPDTAEPRDLELVSRDFDGRPLWLPDDQPVSLVRVLRTAQRTRQAPRTVAARLEALGYRVPARSLLPDTVEPHDLALLSRDLDEQRPWISTDRPVPLGHILMAAEKTRTTPAAAAARLRELGCRFLADAPPPDALGADDLLLLSSGLNGLAPWLSADRAVPVGHVLRAADRLGLGPDEVAGRLAALGHPHIRNIPLPSTVDPYDLVLTSTAYLDRAVPLGYILAAAQETGLPLRATADRLRALGYLLPEEAVLPDEIEPSDMILLSTDRLHNSQWLPRGPVPLHHVLESAQASGLGPRAVADRLRALGHPLNEDTVPPETSDPYDLVLISRNLDGDRPWLPPGQAPLSHLLWAAKVTGRTLARTAERLAELGRPPHPGVVFDPPGATG